MNLSIPVKPLGFGTLFLGAVLLGAAYNRPAEAASFTLSFNSDDLDGGGNPLTGGTIITNQYEDDGISITFSGADGPLILFDSSCGNATGLSPCSGGDSDLATGPGAGNGNALTETLGNLLIIQERNVPVSTPDDERRGGTISFEFLGPQFSNGVTLESITLVDVDDNGDTGGIDIFGTSSVDDSISPLFSTTFGATLLTNNPGDNSIIEFDFSNSPANPISGFDVEFPGSGAIASITFSADVPTDDIPEPLSIIGSTIALGAGYAYRRKRSAE